MDEQLAEVDDQSFGGVVFGEQEQILLLETKAKHGGPDRWGFPKGHPRWNETGPAAAMRETLEETGIEIDMAHRTVCHDVG
eukprot:1412938-Alexandrium_andersonii.AAC.1